MSVVEASVKVVVTDSVMYEIEDCGKGVLVLVLVSVLVTISVDVATMHTEPD